MYLFFKYYSTEALKLALKIPYLIWYPFLLKVSPKWILISNFILHFCHQRQCCEFSVNSTSNYCILNEIWFSWGGISSPITYWDLWFYSKLGTLPSQLPWISVWPSMSTNLCFLKWFFRAIIMQSLLKVVTKTKFPVY